MIRWRWLIWSLYLAAWTIALLVPQPPTTGLGPIRDFVELHRYLIAKAVHVTAYAVLALLTGWLRAPVRSRWLLAFFLAAHGTVTELLQKAMNELNWLTRIGNLYDVGFDNLGVLIGLLLSWKWWTREE